MDAEKIVHDVAEKVREVITQAEERAAEIVRDAEIDASGIRERAEVEARSRLDEVRNAFEEFQGRFGSGAEAPPADSSPSAMAVDLSAEVSPGPVVVPEPQPPSEPEPGPVPVPEPSPDPFPEPTPEPIPEPTPPPDEATPPMAGNGRAKSGDAAGARLVAMNMALDGASREQIEGKLAEDFDLEESGAIVEDVLTLAAR